MCSFFIMMTAFALSAADTAPNPICAALEGGIGKCTCTSGDSALSAKIACDTSFTLPVLGDKTVGVTMNLSPCTKEASASIDFDYDGKTYQLGNLTAGSEEKIPIPYFSFDIGVVSAGAYALFKLDGDLSAITVNLGFTVCGKIPFKGNECGDDITGVHGLPITLIDDKTFNISDACGSGPAPEPAPGPPGPAPGPPGPAPGPPATPTSGASGVNLGLIIGLAISGAINVILVVVGMVWCAKSRAARDANKDLDTVIEDNDGAKMITNNIQSDPAGR